MMNQQRQAQEEMVMGCCLYEERAIDAFVRRGGTAKWFSDRELFRIAEIMMDMYSHGKTADAHSIGVRLPDYADRMDDCIDKSPMVSQIDEYVETLHGFMKIDKLSEFSERLTTVLAKTTPDEADVMLAKVEGYIHTMLTGEKIAEMTMIEAGIKSLDAIEAGDAGGLIDWAHPAITRSMGRLDKEIVWICALPSVGKTALALQWQRTLADKSIVSSLASLESKKTPLVWRHVSAIGGINTLKIKQGKGSEDDLVLVRKIIKGLDQKHMRLTDQRMSIDQIYAWARDEVRHGSKLIMVDNTRHIDVPQTTDRREKTEIMSSYFKRIRDDLDVPVVVFHHSKLDNGKEAVSWSADIERDADALIFLSANEDESSFNNGRYRCCIDFRISKMREGASGISVQLEFIKEVQKFRDWAYSDI